MKSRQWLTIVEKGLVMILLALMLIYLGPRLVQPATELFVPKNQYFASSYSGGTFEIEMQQERERTAYGARIAEVSKLVGPIVYLALGILYICLASAIWKFTGMESSEPGASFFSAGKMSRGGFDTKARFPERDIRELLAERMKREVGLAPYGTTEYWQSAAKVLSQWADPSKELRPDTREKLEALARSNDPETRWIAKEALLGHRYDSDSTDDDSDYDSD